MVVYGKEYDVLMNDRVWTWIPGFSFGSAHPDFPQTFTGPVTKNGLPEWNQVYSFYLWGDPRKWNHLDLNYLFTDGHVETFTEVKSRDTRFDRIRVHWGDTQTWLPSGRK